MTQSGHCRFEGYEYVVWQIDINANIRIFLALIFIAQAAVALFGASDFLVVGILYVALCINTAASLVERTGYRLRMVSLAYAILLQTVGAIVVTIWMGAALMFWLTKSPLIGGVLPFPVLFLDFTLGLAPRKIANSITTDFRACLFTQPRQEADIVGYPLFANESDCRAVHCAPEPVRQTALVRRPIGLRCQAWPAADASEAPGKILNCLRELVAAR